MKKEGKTEAKVNKAAEAEERAAKAAERKATKEAAKAARIAKREANRMPEQNGVRRPKPNTLCGQIWALADSLSSEFQQATPIKNLLEATVKEGFNAGNVKAEYARWRKFNGISGRITLNESKEEAA